MSNLQQSAQVLLESYKVLLRLVQLVAKCRPKRINATEINGQFVEDCLDAPQLAQHTSPGLAPSPPFSMANQPITGGRLDDAFQPE
jgi:hypothetical protein